MEQQPAKIRSAVRRGQAESYILTSLVAFAVTVIATRVFLQLTGFPQLGNSVLHIAHALWGGLFLIVAAYLPLAFANRWALQASAIMGGVGIGLFIDEVGKFITQANDYFFPPALPLIYGFVLLNVLVYLYFRRPPRANPRQALYCALEGLQDVVDGDLDLAEAARIEAQLEIVRQSRRVELVALADTLGQYLKAERGRLSAAQPGFWKRLTRQLDTVGQRLSRRRHRALISIVLLGWVGFVVGYLVILTQGSPNLDPQVLQWRVPLIGIQVAVGLLMIVAVLFWLTGNEDQGLKFGVSGLLFSLVALQLLYFYLSQFMAITATLIQLAILFVLFVYRRWYLGPEL
jgi:hypothetical protein